MTSGPRIYNLFPLLAGPIEGVPGHDWASHLDRIRRMHFDWVFVNPFHMPGFSGSLYAIKDPYDLHPVVRGPSQRSTEEIVAGFARACDDHGLKFMMDLVVNHTAKDAILAAEHPDWYRRELDGSLYSPRAIDPGNAENVTIWGDLAELDYSHPGIRQGLIDYWSDYIRHYLKLGVKGFRCDAAYQVPAEVWTALIGAARDVAPDAFFAAETLGCTLKEVKALEESGFDMFHNSAKWWDFRESWLLDQYAMFRHIAPSIAFPESHDTPRLVSELDDEDPGHVRRHYEQRYLFSALFSSGVMMPMGFEYGFAKPLHVVDSRPEDWEQPRFDLSEFIAAVNQLKIDTPALNVEGPQRRITSPEQNAVALLRFADEHGDEGCVLTLVNPSPLHVLSLDPGPLIGETGGVYEVLRDVTPLAGPQAFLPGTPVDLEPLEVRVIRGERRAKKPVRPSDKLTSAVAAELQEMVRHRFVISNVQPEVDGGRYPVKREVGDVLEVWADMVGDGHNVVSAVLKYRVKGEQGWDESPMTLVDNDRWSGKIPLTRNARYQYTIEVWVDEFETWRRDFIKKHAAGVPIGLELEEGRLMVVETAARARDPADKKHLEDLAGQLIHAAEGERVESLLDPELRTLMNRWSDRSLATQYKMLEVTVDRTAARYAAWYEMFWRSQGTDPHRGSTIDECIARLPYVRDMGFDVVYWVPHHPIGRINRKGKNNTLNAGPEDPGSPYAIGAEEGGHKDVHPELGTLEDFRRFVQAAHQHGLEMAIDFAIQCSPDHPWIKQHPEWFDWRPDGSIKYAENPPKKYEDIVNVEFYGEHLPALWLELRDIVVFWIEQGVKIFRVDNPHTKALPFWEWLIGTVQEQYPEAIFLAEAFTRPKLMQALAKVGYTQSYSYFTWRNTKQELTEYLTELTQSPIKEYMRANFFPNTPDILPKILQEGGRPAFMHRIVLATTANSVYGMYNGYELCENAPVPGKEEYLNSEKYQYKVWDWNRAGNIRDYITRLNRIRRENPALHEYENLRLYNAWNDHVLYYGKATANMDNVVLVAVNLDPYNYQEAHFEVPLWEFGLPDHASVEVEDLFSGNRWIWHGKIQRVGLDPHDNPAAIWRIRPMGSPDY